MQKAAWIRIAVTVEADDEPAHDFSRTAVEAVKASVTLEPPGRYKNLKMTITRIYEDSTPPEDQGTPEDSAVRDENAMNARSGIASAAASTKPAPKPVSAPTDSNDSSLAAIMHGAAEK